MALILSRFYGWERTCSADIHLPKNSRGMSLCLLADGSVFFYSLHKKIFYLASPDLFFFFAGFFCFASFFRLSFCSFSSSGGIFITWSSPLNRVKISGDWYFSLNFSICYGVSEVKSSSVSPTTRKVPAIAS